MNVLPVLHYVAKYGNELSSFYEKRLRGEDPLAVQKEAPTKTATEGEPQPNQLEIDWTVIDDSAPQKTIDLKETPQATIDWDIQVEDTGSSEVSKCNSKYFEAIREVYFYVLCFLSPRTAENRVGFGRGIGSGRGNGN